MNRLSTKFVPVSLRNLLRSKLVVRSFSHHLTNLTINRNERTDYRNRLRSSTDILFLSIASRKMSVVVEPLESLGDSITTAVLVSWSKEPGDSVSEDDVIAIVETDKVTMDIRSKKSGIFLEALVTKQSEISVGSPLYKIDTSVTSLPIQTAAIISTADQVPAAPITEPEVKEVIINVPIMGESITTGMLSKWNSNTGDFVKIDEVVANIETDKVNVEVRSPQSGILHKRFHEEGDEVSMIT